MEDTCESQRVWKEKLEKKAQNYYGNEQISMMKVKFSLY